MRSPLFPGGRQEGVGAPEPHLTSPLKGEVNAHSPCPRGRWRGWELKGAKIKNPVYTLEVLYWD